MAPDDGPLRADRDGLSSRAIKQSILQLLEAEGFSAAGVARATSDPSRAVRLSAFLGAGWHGEMQWLADRARLRADPRALWPEAKSAILAGLSYAPARDPLAALTDKTGSAISVYAAGTDYHDVLKARLARVAAAMTANWGAQAKAMVDTAALMEKPLAEKAGLGWQGKHTNLVSRRDGSWLFLGAILTDLDLPPDDPYTDQCGSCRACLDICPTKAFPAPYQLDARRCISYLTIEHKGPIPREFRAAIGNRIYGCDDCLAVCPWNKFAAASREAAFAPRAELAGPRLAALAALGDAAFRSLFAGSPIKRIGRARFVRNVLIAIGNSGEPALAGVAEARIDDASPLVRGAAVWALSRLVDGNIFRTLMNSNLAGETDQSVRAEWAAECLPNAFPSPLAGEG